MTVVCPVVTARNSCCGKVMFSQAGYVRVGGYAGWGVVVLVYL